MSPETFADLLDRATGDPPPAPASYVDVRAGRARLRRRRVGGLAVLTAAVLAAGGVLVIGLPGGERAHDVTAGWTEGSVLERCLAGHSNGPGEVALRASGEPVVERWVRTDLKIEAAIASADGTMWAECWIWLLPQADGERTAGMSFYTATPAPPGGPSGGFEVGTGCGVPQTRARGCDFWSVSGVDKLPPEVAAVRYDLGDDTSVTVPTVHGFLVLNVRHPLPPGAGIDHNGGVTGFDWGRQISYLDADGTVLAAARLDDPRDPDVPGVPPLRDYRSLGRPWAP